MSRMIGRSKAPSTKKIPPAARAHFSRAGYRKTFTLPQDYAEKHVWIEFDGTMANSDVWINGFHLGQRPTGFVTLRYNVTGHLNIGVNQPNVLAVRADNSRQPASRWYAAAGIYRHVRLIAASAVHFEPCSTFFTTLRRRSPFLPSCEGQFRCDRDGRFQRPVDGAEVRKHAMHPLGGLPVLGSRLQAQHHVNAPDDQHSILHLHFTCSIRRQLPGRCIDLTRLQRAPEGPGESTRHCRDNVVQRGRMGLKDVRWHFVVLRHCAMYSEQNGGLLRGQPCAPQRSLDSLDPHIRHVR